MCIILQRNKKKCYQHKLDLVEEVRPSRHIKSKLTFLLGERHIISGNASNKIIFIVESI